MATANIYLIFNGNCEKAFDFYKSVFGGEFCYVGRYGEMPLSEGEVGCAMPDENKNRIMHVGLPIGKNTMLMGEDNMKENEGETVFGNNFSICVTPDSREEADALFCELSTGGRVLKPIKEEFWGDYYGQVTDQFGVNWMICYELPKA